MIIGTIPTDSICGIWVGPDNIWRDVHIINAEELNCIDHAGNCFDGVFCECEIIWWGKFESAVKVLSYYSVSEWIGFQYKVIAVHQSVNCTG